MSRPSVTLPTIIFSYSQLLKSHIKMAIILNLIFQKRCKYTSEKSVLLSACLTYNPTERHMLWYSIWDISYTLKNRPSRSMAHYSWYYQQIMFHLQLQSQHIRNVSKYEIYIFILSYMLSIVLARSL